MAARTSSGDSLEALKPLVGEWRMVPTFKDMPPADLGARVTFEWLPGERFLIQRWEVPVSEAPDGIAIIGLDPEREGNYLQHYFDSRGVVRLYEMTFDGREWTLRREQPDFSELPFRQRFSGVLDGDEIRGRWERADRAGDWTLDFEIGYFRVG